MFLVLSKIFFFFITPANWIIFLLASRFFIVNQVVKRRVTIAAVIIFLLFSNEIIYNKAITAWEVEPVEINRPYEAGILLGGMGWYQQGTSGFFKGSADRFIQTAKLYKQGKIEKIIISAGEIRKHNPTEANFLRSQFIAMGVEAADIIVEDKSRNTFENASFTRRKVDSLNLKGPFVLITSARHMARAQMVFNKAGLQTVSYPCDYETSNRKPYLTDYFWPNFHVLDSWGSLIKEWAGIVAYKVTGKL